MTDRRNEHPGGPYRVEHHAGPKVAVIGRIEHCFPHHTSLTPFAVHLHLAGRAVGEVRLVDEQTEVVVARRALARGFRLPSRPPNTGHRPAPRRDSGR